MLKAHVAAAMSYLPASIPSPSRGVWWLGPIPLRAYGILMVAAMALAIWITHRRYVARGGAGDVVYDTSIWAIAFGVIGGRLYHVATTPKQYFGEGNDPWEFLKIWEGGMAIWGAVGLGAVGAVIGLRIAKQRVGPFADAVAPGLLLAQVLGRWGNYFNQELFGGPTTLPWGLEIDTAHLPADYAEGTLFHPTFLYEGLWNLAMALLLIWLDRRIRFSSGQVMSLYLVMYGVGRFWVEGLRLDEARVFLGLRLNAWTAMAVVILGLVLYYVCGRTAAPTRVLPAEKAAYVLRKGNPQAAAEAEAIGEEQVEIAEEETRLERDEEAASRDDNGD